MTYTTQQIRVDISVIYRTNPLARWSMYGGVGIEFGSSVRASTNVYYSEYSFIESSGSSSNGSNTMFRYETIANKNNIGGAAYLPLGVDFRVGKKREFFKQMHFFYEARPFLNYLNIPELGTIASVGMKSGIGLRITI